MLRIDEIEKSDSMLDVATLNEKDDAFKMIFDVDIKMMMIEKFDCVDSLICFFAKDLIVSMTYFLTDLNMIKSIIRFFLIHVTNETR